MQIMNMGNYAHGNQPVQHMIYMYNYGGQPWKSQYWVRRVMDKFYNAQPNGYCGDEDNGQTSAWYVFSALGFYPVCPAADQYVIGSPLVKEANIRLNNGRTLQIKANDNSPKNVYVQDIRVNGKELNRNYFTFEELNEGGNINFQMGADANTQRGTEASAAPFSQSVKK